MHMSIVTWSLEKVRLAAQEDCATKRPAMTAAMSAMTPSTLGMSTFTLPPAPWVFPNMPQPIRTAMGMVQPMVNTPHGLCARAFTTTTPRPASVTSRMSSTAKVAAIPAKGPTSVRAMSASDFPLWRTEATRTTKSCTQPASTAPKRIQMKPGAKPNCAARVGPTSGPAPAMAAKWWPKRTHFGDAT